MFRCHERVEPCRGRDCTVGRHSADNLKAPHAANQPLGNVSSWPTAGTGGRQLRSRSARLGARTFRNRAAVESASPNSPAFQEAACGGYGQPAIKSRSPLPAFRLANSCGRLRTLSPPFEVPSRLHGMTTRPDSLTKRCHAPSNGSQAGSCDSLSTSGVGKSRRRAVPAPSSSFAARLSDPYRQAAACSSAKFSNRRGACPVMACTSGLIPAAHPWRYT